MQKIVIIYMIKSIQNEAFIYNSYAYTKCGLYKLVDSYTFRRHILNLLIHINSEATTICAIYKTCHGYEIGNQILRAHFTMFVWRSWMSSCTNHFSIPSKKGVTIRTHPLLIRVPCNPHVGPYLQNWNQSVNHPRVALPETL